MKRYAIIFLSTILTCVILTSCQKAEPTNVSTVGLQTSTLSLSPTPTTFQDKSDLTFADLANINFTLETGARASCTTLKIAQDGSFSGNYSDHDMADVGTNYPNGTNYSCSFSGKFTELKKTGDYEYTMKCESLIQEGNVGDIEIGEEGLRYVTSSPFGLENADEIKLYLPGKDVNELPEKFKEWVGRPLNIDFESVDVLTMYGLYNVKDEQGFFS